MKKKIIIALVVIALIAAGAAGMILYRNYLKETYITIGGQQYLRNTESLSITVTSGEDLQLLTELHDLKNLDLGDSRLTTGEYDALQAALPGCAIRWEVPFQGGVSSDTEKLNITELSEEDIPLLAYLPELTKVNARGCTDYDQLVALTEAYPELEVYYSVEMGGQFWPNSTTALELESVTLEELATLTRYFPQLQSVKLTEIPGDPEDMLVLQETYPEISFSWQLVVCGVTVDAAAAEIDLSGIPMTDTSELESMLKYLPNLTKVDMVDCGISNEEMEALNNRNEGILFVWTVKIGSLTVRTDVTEFMPVKHDEWVNNAECVNLRYLTELIALDLGHMFIDSCDFVRYMPHLKYLILADTDVFSLEPLTGLDELIFLEIFMCPVVDYSPLLTLTALEDLNISYTYGDYQVIAQMTWLDRLWWGQVQTSRITDAQRDYLREVLPDTEIEFQPQSSTGKGWRMGQNYYDMRDIFGMGYMTT